MGITTMPLALRGWSVCLPGARSPGRVRLASTSARTPCRQLNSPATCTSHESTCALSLRIGLDSPPLPEQVLCAGTGKLEVRLAATHASTASDAAHGLIRPDTVDHLPCTRESLESVDNSC